MDPRWQASAVTFREHAGERPAWIAASTHPEEEAAVVAIHKRLRERWPDLLRLWAPRHPERFRPVSQAAIDAGWRVATRSEEHTSELQSLMRNSYAVFCLNKQKKEPRSNQRD